MNIIKEYCPSAKTVVIRSDSYGSSMSYIQKLLNEARKDFDVNLDTCTVVHFGGERYANTFGIEFPADDAPEEYIRINQLEYTR